MAEMPPETSAYREHLRERRHRIIITKYVLVPGFIGLGVLLYVWLLMIGRPFEYSQSRLFILVALMMLGLSVAVALAVRG